MSRGAERRLALVVLLAALGCAPDHDAPVLPQLIRLLDEHPVAQRLPFDVNDREALIAACSMSVTRLSAAALVDERSLVIDGANTTTPLPALLAAAPARLVGEGDAAQLNLRPPETFIRPLDLDGSGPLLVRTWVAGEEASVALLPLRRGEQLGGRLAEQGSDLAALGERLVREGLPLSGSGDREGCWLSAVVPAVVPPAQPGDSARDGLALVAVARTRPMTLGRTEVRRLTALGAALLSPGLRPSPGQVMLGNECREALILPTGARLSWQLTVPGNAPWLEFDMASLAASSALEVRWNVEPVPATDDPASKPWQLSWMPAPHDGTQHWSARRFNLSAVAGKDVLLTVTVGGDSGAALLGRPHLAGRPRSLAKRPPDVLLVVLDTLRADRVLPGAPASPRLQALADGAVRFSEASSTSSWTLPAHASLFSGRWPQTHGVTDKFRRLDESAPRLARAFRDAGYETVAFTGGGFVAPLYGMAAGFERYGVSDPCTLGVDAETGEPTRQVGSRAELKSLLAEPERRPVFAFVHTFAAHHGMPRPDELARFGLQSRDFLRLRDVIAELTAAQEAQRPQALDGATVTELRALYDASVLAVDELVGDIVDTLIEAGRFDDTVLVVTSDHGQELFERGAFGHGHQLHTELLRIPLIVHAPGVVSRVVDAPVSLVDIGPTLRELADLPADQGAHGRSLVPLLRGDTLPSVPLLSHLAYVPGAPTHQLRREALSLHLSEDHGSLRAVSLFDLAADPEEQTDLLSARPGTADALRVEYETALASLRAESGPAAAQLTLDPETRRRLVELGYLSDG